METKYKIHGFYIITILVSIIIGLVSVEWSEVPKLVDYFSFALTLSSIILAVLAIIFTLHSNTSISNLLNNVSLAANKISSSSVNLESIHLDLKSKLDDIPKRIDQFDKKLMKPMLIC